MAQAKLEIEIVDNGGSAVGAPPPAPASTADQGSVNAAIAAPPVQPPPPPLSPDPGDSDSKPKSAKNAPVEPHDPSGRAPRRPGPRDDDSNRPWDAATDGIKQLARVLGYGGLVTASETLVKAFREVTAATQTDAKKTVAMPSSTPSETAATQVKAPLSDKEFIERLQGIGDKRAAGTLSKQEYDKAYRELESLSLGKAKKTAVKHPDAAPAAASTPPPLPPRGIPVPVAPTAAAPAATAVVASAAAPAAAAPAAASGAAAGGAAAGATEAVGGMAALSVVIPPVAIVLTAVAVAGTLAAAAFKKVVEKAIAFADYLADQARSLAKYSGALAAATAMTDIRQQKSEMNRAQEIGPLLSKFENDRSRASAAFYSLGTTANKILLELYNLVRPIVTTGISALELTSENISGMLALMHYIWNYITNDLAEAAENWKEVIKHAKRIAQILEGEQVLDDPFDDPYTNEFLGIFASPKEIEAARARGNKAYAARKAAGEKF